MCFSFFSFFFSLLDDSKITCAIRTAGSSRETSVSVLLDESVVFESIDPVDGISESRDVRNNPAFMKLIFIVGSELLFRPSGNFIRVRAVTRLRDHYSLVTIIIVIQFSSNL